jgi:hypothetical protein
MRPGSVRTRSSSTPAEIAGVGVKKRDRFDASDSALKPALTTAPSPGTIARISQRVPPRIPVRSLMKPTVAPSVRSYNPLRS